MRFVKYCVPFIIVLVAFFGCPKKQVVKPPEVVPETTVTIVPVPEETVPVEPERPALVLNRIFFDFDKSDIRQDAAEILKQNAEMLKIYPEVKIVIEGHCCEIGTSEYNMALGERRAKAARDYLVMLGVPAGQMTTLSYGEERPLDPKVLEKNRRCEFVVQ
jgi:peptidoglycan-associated lipoprotein